MLVLLVAVGGVTVLRANDLDVPDKAKIEALISHVASLDGAAFVRNGSEYDSKNAAKFLTAKWNTKKKEIHTAADFIQQAATKSDTTGMPYNIRFQDGKEMPCGAYLIARLKKIESNPPVKP